MTKVRSKVGAEGIGGIANSSGIVVSNAVPSSSVEDLHRAGRFSNVIGQEHKTLKRMIWEPSN